MSDTSADASRGAHQPMRAGWRGGAGPGPSRGRHESPQRSNRKRSRPAFLGGSALAQPVDVAQAATATGPRNTNTFYPEDFGARGDGSTNDTAAVQACLDAAVGAGGGTVQFGVS
jgi:polygalacturonase